MRKYVLGLLCLVCISLAWAQEMPTITAQDIPADIAALIPTVTISAQPYYLKGRPIPVTIKCSYDRGRRPLMGVDHVTLLPSFLQLSLSDATGKQLPSKRLSTGVRGDAPPLVGGRYLAQKGEAHDFGTDLTTLFDITTAGRYVLTTYFPVRLQDGQKQVVLATADISLYDTTKVADVAKIESPFTAAVEQTDIDGTLTRFLHVTYPYTRVGNSMPGTRSADLPLRANTTVKTAQRDYRNALWFLLDTGTERSLMVFDVEHQQFLTLIPWGQAQIEFGAVQSNIDSTKVVIAGVAGKPRITSTSLPWLLQQPQTVQLP